jgi:hypothetical protein
MTLKELITGGTGKTVILGAICYQIATKTWQVGQVGSGLNRGGSAPSLSHLSRDWISGDRQSHTTEAVHATVYAKNQFTSMSPIQSSISCRIRTIHRMPIATRSARLHYLWMYRIRDSR